MRELIEEVKQQSKVNLQINDKTINAIVTNSKEVGQLITETLRKEKQTLSNNEKHKNQKLNIKTLWRNTINTRKQAFWQHHKAKRTYETFSNLLVMDPPRMPRKFLPRFIKNENEEEPETRHQLATEKFKSEIILQKKRSEKYQENFMKIDAEMITYLTRHFENNEVCNALIKEWETDCTKVEEISIQIFNKKENFFLNNSSSEYRNKPNRDVNANRTSDNAWFEKRKENKTPNRSNHSRSRSRSESRNSNNRRDKSKSTERIVLPPRNNQNRSTRNKTEDNRGKYELKKRNIFSKR